MTLPWRSDTTEDIAAEVDSRYETPGGAQHKVNVSQEYLLNLLKLAVTGLSNGSEAAIARHSDPYNITYDWLKDRLDAADTRHIQLLSNVGYLYATQRNILTVAKVGGQFTTINAAITYARSYCTITNRVTIVVSDGLYNEEIILMPNPGIDIVGSGDNTRISYPSQYPNSPIYTVGFGYFQNLTFINETGGTSYAFHFESQTNPATGYVKFVNCSFLSDSLAGVGIGLGQDTGVQFVGCDISSNSSQPGVYAHNYPANNISNQLLEIRNTKISTYGGSYSILIDDAAKLYGYSNSKMSIIFANCESNVPKIQYRNGSTTLSYIPKTGTDITLGSGSANTHILGVNINEADTSIGGICFVGGTGLFTITISRAQSRDYTVLTAVRTNDGVDIASTVSVSGVGENYVAFTTSDVTVRGNSININLRATAK